ncbi:MAG: GNAT family N-acetyltransferase [Hyphomicrobiales bacterium]
MSAFAPFRPVPVTLEGRRVRLEPLDPERHLAGLLEIGLEPELWRLSLSAISSEADLRRYVDAALAERAAGRSLPFATIDVASGRVAGSTRFGNIEPAHRKVEIGWTWLGAPFRRTHVNTEAKYLMLRHAFETWGCVRVELKTDARNRRSRDAMLRIGATEEGTLRKHMVGETGYVRDTVYFSVIDGEWPSVKARLETMIDR